MLLKFYQCIHCEVNGGGVFLMIMLTVQFLHEVGILITEENQILNSLIFYVCEISICETHSRNLDTSS